MVQYLLLSLALGVGQTEPPPTEQKPAPAVAVSETPAPNPVPPPPPAPAPPPDRWLLMQTLQGTWPGWLLDGNRIQIYGWNDGSFTASSAAQENLPLGLNYRANEFLEQQTWLRIERTVVTTGTSEPTFGFRSDTIVGSDYRFTLPRGIFNRQLTDGQDGGPNEYGIDPLQFYVEGYFPTIGRGLDVKVGRINCQFGAELTEAIGNPFPSHSYTYFYNPFTHTGVVATQQLTPEWSVQAGAVMGPDVFFDTAASPYGMFSVKWAPPNGRDSILVSTLLGSGRYDVGEQFNNPNLVDLVYTHQFNPVLNYTFEGLFGYENNVPGIGTATWFGLVQYLNCKFTPRLSGGTRLEFFDDVDGNRTGFPGLYTSAAACLNFKPLHSLIIRPEIRFDVNCDSRPFEDKHGLLTAVIDVIRRW